MRWMQTLFGVKIDPWEAQLGCALSPFGFFLAIVAAIVWLGLWTLWKGGLLVTGYNLVVGAGQIPRSEYLRPEHPLSPYPVQGGRYW